MQKDIEFFRLCAEHSEWLHDEQEALRARILELKENEAGFEAFTLEAMLKVIDSRIAYGAAYERGEQYSD